MIPTGRLEVFDDQGNKGRAKRERERGTKRERQREREKQTKEESAMSFILRISLAESSFKKQLTRKAQPQR